MHNKKIAATLAVAVTASMLTACGPVNEEQQYSNETETAEIIEDETVTEDETVENDFKPSEEKFEAVYGPASINGYR